MFRSSKRQNLTIIVLCAVTTVASTIPTPCPHQWVAVGPLVPWSLVRRHSLIRRARRNNPQEQHTHKHHTESTHAQKQQQTSRVVRESNTRHKSEQESAQAKSAQRKSRRRSSMARPVGGTGLDRSAERTAAPNTGQEAEEAQQADRVSMSTSLVCAVQREISASQADTSEQYTGSRASFVYQQAGWDAHCVHSEVACISNDVHLGCRQVEAFGERGSPCREAIVCAAGEGYEGAGYD